MQIISILALAAAAEATLFGRGANCDVDCQRDYRAVNYMRSDTSASSYCSSLYAPAPTTSVKVVAVTSTRSIANPSGTITITSQGGSTITSTKTTITTLTSTVTSTTDVCSDEGYSTTTTALTYTKRYFAGDNPTTTASAPNADPSCAKAPGCLKGVQCSTVQALCKCLMATATPTTVTSTSTSTNVVTKTACPITTTKVVNPTITTTLTQTSTVTSTALATNTIDINGEDSNNCGGCGNVCQPGTKCHGGFCFWYT